MPTDRDNREERETRTQRLLDRAKALSAHAAQVREQSAEAIKRSEELIATEPTGMSSLATVSAARPGPP